MTIDFTDDYHDDSGDYPSEHFLQWLENLEVHAYLPDVFHHMRRAWHWENWAAETRPGIHVFATGGWSGNESIIAAFDQSLASILAHGESISIPGGLYVFATSDTAKAELDTLRHYIASWAWATTPREQKHPSSPFL